MYKRGIYKIISNEPLTKAVSGEPPTHAVWRMKLSGDTSHITAPGQFVNVELEGKFLRRPISVCDYDDGTLTIIYKVVGDGTAMMSRLAAGAALDLLTGLGNGFSIEAASKKPLLVGGGVGVPPLYNLARKLASLSGGRIEKVSVVLGFNCGTEIFYADEFRELGADVYISTLDGSVGTKGFVTDAIMENNIAYDYIYACGPEPMLRALGGVARSGGQFSFEERMGCGFGACMGCSCRTKYGYKRICKEGPVLTADEIIW